MERGWCLALIVPSCEEAFWTAAIAAADGTSSSAVAVVAEVMGLVVVLDKGEPAAVMEEGEEGIEVSAVFAVEADQRKVLALPLP
jgi:hypothetical protein